MACVAALGLLAVPAVRAEGDPTKAILDRAVKALGGENKLAAAGGLTWKVSGSLEIEGMRIDLSGDWSAQGLDRYRWDAQASVMGRTENATVVAVGGKVWARDGRDRVMDAPKEIVPMLLANFRCFRLVQNPLLLRDKAFKLSPLGELKIGDRETVGLKVTRKGWTDIDLFFDKKTGLPFKTEIHIKESKDGMDVSHAFVFDGYKEFGGLKHFGKVRFLRDDKALLKLECTEVKAHEKLDDSVFAKPAKGSE